MHFSNLLITMVASVSMASPPSAVPRPFRRASLWSVAFPFWKVKVLRGRKISQCASCHHIPLMIWGLGEGRRQGYTVNLEAFHQATSWVLADGNLAKVFPDLPLDKERSEPDYLGPLNMALAIM